MTTLKYSLDGHTFLNAPNGIHVQHIDIETSTDEVQPYLQFYHHDTGLITDAYSQNGDCISEENLDNDDIFCRIVGDIPEQAPAPAKVQVQPLEMNEHLLSILGRPNFTCRELSIVLRLNGHKIRTKAEDEQAHTILFLLNQYLAHGENWVEKANEEIKRLAEVGKARVAEMKSSVEVIRTMYTAGD